MLKDEFLGYLRLEKNYSENTIINYTGERKDLTNLSHLFTRMLYSTSKVETPATFARSYEFNGELLRTSIQEDAYEMAADLANKLMDDKTIGSKVRNLLQGESAAYIDGINIDYHSESTQISLFSK